MKAMRFRPDDESGRESGFTIIELLVTMVVTGIVLALMGTFFANISRLTSWSGNDRNATGQAALAIDAVRATIRTAAKTSDTAAGAAVQYASATRLTVVAYSNIADPAAAPELVTFCLQSGTLSVNRQAGISQDQNTKTWSFPSRTIATSGDCSDTKNWQTVATGFSMSAASPFFAYLDTHSLPLKTNPTLSDADRRDNVTFVQVVATLDSTQTNGSGRPVIVSSAIGMPGVTRDVDPTATVPNLPTPTETPTPTPTIPKATATSAPSSSSSTSASATPSSGSSGGSGTGSGSGSGSGTGTGTSTPGTGSGGSGGSGGGSGTSTPAPSTTTPKATATPTATATATATPTKTATPKPTPPQVIDY